MKNSIDTEIKRDKISWLGIDGALVVSYFVLEVIAFLCFTQKIDFVMEWLFPIALLVIVTYIFINYCFQVYKFMKQKNIEIAEIEAKKKEA